jgi:hypothetical protein
LLSLIIGSYCLLLLLIKPIYAEKSFKNKPIFVELKQTIMEEKTVSVWKTTFMPAIYLGIVLILVSVVFYVTGNMFATWASYITIPITIAGIVYGQITHKKEIGGTLTYGQALGSGTITLLYASVVNSIYAILLYKVIDPTLLEQMRIFLEQKFVQQGNIPEEQLDMIVNFTMKLQTPPLSIFTGIAGGAFMGLIISLITGIFVKKNPVDEVPE